MISSFPMNETIFNLSISLSEKVGAVLFQLVSVLFLIRVVFLLVKIAPSYEYSEVIKDTVSFFGLISAFPILLNFIFSAVSGIAQNIQNITVSKGALSISDLLSPLFSKLITTTLFANLADVAITSLVESVYSLFLALLISAGQIFIFLATFFNTTAGLTNYFGSLMSLALWPVTWTLIGKIASEVLAQNESSYVFTIIFWFSTMVLQILSPLFTYSLFKSASTSGSASTMLSAARSMWH